MATISKKRKVQRDHTRVPLPPARSRRARRGGGGAQADGAAAFSRAARAHTRSLPLATAGAPNRGLHGGPACAGGGRAGHRRREYAGRARADPSLFPSLTLSPPSPTTQFVADGVFYAELNELLTRELAEQVCSCVWERVREARENSAADTGIEPPRIGAGARSPAVSPPLTSPPHLHPQGYSGVEVRVTPMRTEVIIRATRTQDVLGVKGRRVRELTAAVQKRFGFADGTVELYAEKVANRGLCAVAQAESLRYKLLGGLAVRRACYGVLRYVMEQGAKGCEVVVSGKLRAQRAKAMKVRERRVGRGGGRQREERSIKQQKHAPPHLHTHTNSSRTATCCPPATPSATMSTLPSATCCCARACWAFRSKS